MTIYDLKKCRGFVSDRFSAITALSSDSKNADYAHFQASLLAMLDDKAVSRRDLGHCLDLLGRALDEIDLAPDGHDHTRRICERLFEMITDRGIWGPEDAESKNEFLPMSAF